MMAEDNESVIHLSSVHPATDPRIFHKEARSLAEAGYDVSYYVHTGQDERRDGVRIRSIGTADSRTERWQNIPTLYQAALAQDADIYHLHDPELIPVGIALGKRTDGRIVYDVHENYRQKIMGREWIPGPLRPPIGRIFPRFQRNVASRFDAVVAATEWVASSFEGDSVSHLAIVRNFPRTEAISIDEPPIKRTHDHILVYVGTVTHNRGLREMGSVLRGLRERGHDAGLWLLGPFGSETTERQFREYLRQHDLEDHVRAFGWTEYEDVFDYLAAGDLGLALVDPDDNRGVIPTKLFEYLYVNIPVLASDMEGTRRYLPDDCGMVVPFEDPIAQISAAETLLTAADSTTERPGSNGRQHVENRYNWNVEKDKLLELYNLIL